MDEAKRLLLYTNNTVSEIAFAIEFTDPSHFVKYLKKYFVQHRKFIALQKIIP